MWLSLSSRTSASRFALPERDVSRSGARKPPKALVAPALILLAGCTSISVGTADGSEFGGIGLYRVRLPATQGNLIAIEREAVGIGWDQSPVNSAWFGYSGSQWVSADPAKCQMLIIIRSETQAANARDILKQLEGTHACIVDHTAKP